jgi:3-hydroxyisobutyrate dehydrogenase-like beta-hydroxyacid dehydrogenase
VEKREVKPTINDVADKAGVSKKTVSRVINRSPLLNDATREKVEKVIAELGYVPNPQARALALRRNFLIGLVHDNPNAQTVLTVQQGILEAIATPNSRWWCARSTGAARPCSTISAISSSSSGCSASSSCRRSRRMMLCPPCVASWAATMCAWARRDSTILAIWSNRTTGRRWRRR